MKWNTAVLFAAAFTLTHRASVAQDAAPAPPPQHVVVGVDGGSVSFKRPAWRQFAPVRFGTVLQEGDLLDLALNASATIVCDGFTTSAMVGGPGIKPVPCAPGKQKPIWWGDIPLIAVSEIDLPTRKDLQSMMVLTGTTETKPSVAWLAVPGAREYRVQITGDDLDWEATTKNNTTRGMADSFPTLKEDSTYEVSVVPVLDERLSRLSRESREKTDAGAATALAGERARMAGLSLLRNQRFRVVGRIEDSVLSGAAIELGKLGLPEPVTTFLKAKLFARYGSYDVALQSLQTIAGSLSASALGRAMGDVYAAKGSMAEAERAFTEAVALYAKDGDTFNRAQTDEALGAVQSKVASKRASAIARLKAALQTYDALGDTVDAARVNALLAVLDPGGSRPISPQ